MNSPDTEDRGTYLQTFSLFLSFYKSPIWERPYCSLTIKTTFVFRHACTSTSVSHFLFTVMRQKRRKNRILYTSHIIINCAVRYYYLVIAVPWRVSFIYHKNIIIETRYNIEGASVYWKHCVFSPIERYLMAILYSCSQRDIHTLFPRTPEQIVRQLDGSVRKEKNVIYFYTNTKLYIIFYSGMADQK